MKPGVKILLCIYPTLLQDPRDRLSVEPVNADGEMIDQAGRALVVEGDEHLRRSETYDLVGLVLIQDRQNFVD